MIVENNLEFNQPTNLVSDYLLQGATGRLWPQVLEALRRQIN